MTLTTDNKKRVVLPGTVPGDVFACEQKGDEILLRRVYRQPGPQKKPTKAQALRAIQTSKFKPSMTWEELRKMTREP